MRCNPQVAPQCQFQAASNRVAFNCSQHGLAQQHPGGIVVWIAAHGLGEIGGGGVDVPGGGVRPAAHPVRPLHLLVPLRTPPPA